MAFKTGTVWSSANIPVGLPKITVPGSMTHVCMPSKWVLEAQELSRVGLTGGYQSFLIT